MKERFERQLPGVCLWLAVHSLAPEHGHAAVDGFGELGVGLSTEDGAVAGVGVEERDFVGGQGEVLLRPFEVVHVEHVGSEEDELSRSSGRVVRRVGQRQQAELVRPIVVASAAG
jgi:hypothetical protein